MSCGKMPISSQFCVRAAAAELWAGGAHTMGGPGGLSCVPRPGWATWVRLALALLPGAGVAETAPPFESDFPRASASSCAHLPPSPQALPGDSSGLVALQSFIDGFLCIFCSP